MEYPTERPLTLCDESEGGRLEMALIAAAPPLRPFVRGYSLFDENRAPPAPMQHLPHRDVTFILCLGGALEVGDPGRSGRQRFGAGQGFLAGLHTEPARTCAEGRQRGVEALLTPLGAHVLLGGLPMQETANRVLSLDDLLGPLTGEWAGRLAESRGLDASFGLLDRLFTQRVLARSGLLPPEPVEFAATASRSPSPSRSPRRTW